jgi:CheY-like chemotaxis protein
MSELQPREINEVTTIEDVEIVEDASPVDISEFIRTKRILLAEDDTEMRNLLTEVLMMDGYEVVGAGDGLELLTSLQESGTQIPDGPFLDVDMIITDVRMPWVSGLDVLRILRERDREMPAIVITAFGDERLHAEAQRLGVTLVLDKPFDIDVFREVVRQSI